MSSSSTSTSIATPTHRKPVTTTTEYSSANTSTLSNHPNPHPRSVFQDVISSIFEPGTNSGLIQAMSWSFYSLFVTLIGMIFLTGGNLHVVALFVLSVGLYASIRWFLIQIKDAEAQQKLEREKEAREKKQDDKQGNKDE